MFERYTETARRAIFFGRWETSEFGSPSIETEHLLLGILKADLALASKYLAIDHPYTSVRAEVERASPSRPPTSTSVDLPLSHEAQRALSYAEEEAQRLNQRQIDTEHLLLGLLREKTTFAAKLLKDHGVTLSEARQSIAKGEVTLEASQAKRSTSTVAGAFRRRGWSGAPHPAPASQLDSENWRSCSSRDRGGFNRLQSIASRVASRHRGIGRQPPPATRGHAQTGTGNWSRVNRRSRISCSRRRKI